MASRATCTERIVSLAPNVTSILLAIGAGRELVGVSKWCAEVASVGRRPRTGDCWHCDVRAIAKLRPTLIIGSVPFRAETVAKLLSIPAPFFASNPRSLKDVMAEIRMLGRITGRTRSAERLVSTMARALRGIGRRAKRMRSSSKRPRVYAEAWPNPRISSPPWVAELITLVGGKMIVPPGKRVSDAEVARGRPDVILLAWTATGDQAKTSSAMRNPAWRDTPAVRTGRVVVVRDEWLNTPGPPLIQGAKALLRALHGKPTETIS